jgi:signal transduction histidine kinase
VHEKIKILHVEDFPDDIELVERELKKANILFEKLVVNNKPNFITALKEFSPCIILCDHSLPSFNSVEALKIVKDRGVKIPFILVTATVSEEFAVSIIKDGAEDYILKDRLQRLPTAILNALVKKRLEYEREKFFNEVIAREQQLKIDITERKNAEMIREKITADLVTHNKDLEQFAYIVSHNLRAPVANILGFCDAIQNLELNDEQKTEMMNGLSFATQKLDNVIADLNHILKVKKEISENKTMVLFSEILENIKTSINEWIKKDKVHIKTNFSQVDEMLALKSYMHSIFYNLITNSIKYREPQVPLLIEITSEGEPDKIILRFKDNGMGINLQKKGDQVFGLYNRFHTHVEGKGMGLFIVKTQVEIMGGKISVTSEVNKGTEFKIEFKI